MHAIQLHQFGDPATSLGVVELPDPDPSTLAAGEVLIEMEFAPINPNDLMLIRGAFTFRPALPSVAGNDGVGRVVAVGPGVVHISVGDRVIAPRYGRTWSELVVAPAADLFTLPTQADVQQLAMLRINPSTAGLLLTEFVNLQEGDWIIQNAANSGVGRSVIAMARVRGVKTVNLVRRPELIAGMRQAGGDLVLLDNEQQIESLEQLTNSGKVRLALDGVSGTATARLASALSSQGVLVGYAQMGGLVSAPGDLRPLMRKDITLHGFYQARPQYSAKIPALLKEGADLIASGRLSVPVAAVYPVKAIVAAVGHAQRGGKVLLDLRRAAWR